MSRAPKLKRTIADRFIPVGALKIVPKDTNVVLYAWTNATGRNASSPFKLMAYRGTQSKSLFFYGFKTETLRAQHAERLIADEVKRSAERRVYQKQDNSCLAVGDTLQALSALERATDAREIWPSFQSALDPVHRPLWGSARYRALLRRVGLGDIVLPAPRTN